MVVVGFFFQEPTFTPSKSKIVAMPLQTDLPDLQDDPSPPPLSQEAEATQLEWPPKSLRMNGRKTPQSSRPTICGVRGIGQVAKLPAARAEVL